MTKSFIHIMLLAVALLIGGCTSNVYVDPIVESEPVAMVFVGQGSNSAAATRATGSDAANLLGNAFRVFATNDGGRVFDNYVIRWTGGPTVSPTNNMGWEYVGYMSQSATPVLQNPKYWDESSTRYDFVAFAGLGDDQLISDIDANTYLVDASNMQTLYMANRVSAAPVHIAAVPGVSPEFVPYNTPVRFDFRRAVSRIRVGFYETILGYAVKDLRFYYDDNADAPMGTSDRQQVALQGVYPMAGNYTISYDATNVAHATLDLFGATMANSRLLGMPAYTYAPTQMADQPYLMADGTPDAVGEPVFLGTSSATATYARSTEVIDNQTMDNSPWHTILPYEGNTTPLTLRVDYTLVALDGTHDSIRVRDARAVVPITYCQWRPNYSYTYIFKITSQAGYTGDGTAPDGLYPITFDAEVSDIQDGMTYELDVE